ncbi:RiPP maturation radical SAM C-methyltransferase [Actinophytocola xanthii]|uniref:B12-binding domain-containing radical SAM protein n=1 Tax=Actinophytocola xanthii TaxID=1912961 RepID=A0A1Q8CY16_9PSEU|nr:RiPP maturation radical SAM C-methyltransferase [Actinophytocola xanthii]OLF19251.1 B12-binding domain-containing radical SAM protein [Actinophytocola xanthii]
MTTPDRTTPRTVIVSMPFMDLDRPSIQLGLLKAIGESHGFPVDTLHANLDFAARIGVDRYRALADHHCRLVGEWLFSVEAFGDAAPDPEAGLLSRFATELRRLDGLRETRDRDVPAYLDALLEEYPWHEVGVVGFSATFQQNAASFALARRLKERFPDIVTVFGGANFDGEMGPELVRSVECVDYAVVGEGDTAFPALLSALASGAEPSGIPGVASRGGATPPAPPSVELDDLPMPEYGEYYTRAGRLGLRCDSGWLPFESARGCWWGAKHHCAFCGLNGTAMRFRAKSPARVRAELAHQARRYGRFRFAAVDNILDPRYLTELFPAVTEDRADYQFFYEVKANLTRAQLRVLAGAGVTHLQPGIESLSTDVLRLMDKGVRAAQNVSLLKWARYYGIGVSWNILWGFPGETEEDYARQAAAVPHLVHLQPPATAARVWLERFSPMFTRPERYRTRRREPEPSYRYVYPADVDLERIAYVFDYEFEDALPAATYAPLSKAVAEWSRAWESDLPPALVYRSSPGYLEIYDVRHPGDAGVHTFRDTLAAIYLACDERPTTATAVRRRLALDVPVSAIEDAFRQFAERGLMFLDGNLALSLAIPATPGR